MDVLYTLMARSGLLVLPTQALPLSSPSACSTACGVAWYTLASLPVDTQPWISLNSPRFSILNSTRRVRGSNACHVISQNRMCEGRALDPNGVTAARTWRGGPLLLADKGGYMRGKGEIRA